MRTSEYRHLIEFKNSNDATEHIKWCRRNLGERGVDWDFMGSYRKAQVVIYNPKYVLFYTLKFE